MLTLNKTKAALQSCQCHYEKPKQIKHTKVNAGGQRMSQRNSAPADYIQFFSSSLAFLRWRRLISPRIEVTINPALLSPSSLSDSISATTSCGTRTVKSCDFAFLLEVAITDSLVIWCVSVYAKKSYAQCLKCVSLECSFKSEGETHLVNSEARQCANTNRASYHNVIGANTMDDLHHTQTRPEFTWRFISASERYPTAKPLVIYVNASSEQEARETMPGVNLIFAARLPFHDFRVVEVCHA
ncbi:host cell division inhibitor Icd-like protein [Enterobacter cloacae complex sp. 357B1]|uniref:host cell division inhibitor Icd-like protein n=1 Tax=Enterobacter cloacae complex sp. 357B1 TaxID=3395827 RepID=UPI003CEBCFFA